MAYPGSGAQSPRYDDGHRLQDMPHAAVSCRMINLLQLCLLTCL